MKVPLEPIPKETALLAKHADSDSGNRAGGSQGSFPGNTGVMGMLSLSPDQANKAYPWLLGVSITISALLCWLYVTKPVIVERGSSSESQAKSIAAGGSGEALLSGSNKGKSMDGKAALLPSDSALPGSNSAMKHAADSKSPAHLPPNDRSPRAIAPAMLARSHANANGSPLSLGWESTNLKVQHILSVDTGSEELEKIVMNVPVLYKTRTLRWSMEDIAKARGVMKRLIEYEGNLNKLRSEAQGILKDWNEILETTAPTVALRADSPSLPYNHGHGREPETLPDSSTVIKLEP